MEKSKDRIKRSILKNEHCYGGLNITDVECLDKALKLRQFIRANNSDHAIKDIQKYCSKESGKEFGILKDYTKNLQTEAVSYNAKLALNSLCDYTRQKLINDYAQYLDSTHAIEFMSSTNVGRYLIRNGKTLINCLYTPLRKDGIISLAELVREEETELCKTRLIRIRNVLKNFPKEMLEYAKCFDEDMNKDEDLLTHLLTNEDKWMRIEDLTTKEFQVILKNSLGKISQQDFDSRLGIQDYDNSNITKFRQSCKNVKLRHIFFRLLNKDFYSKDRMFRFKMIDNETCDRCGQTETFKHLLWECSESKRIWQAYNALLEQSELQDFKINDFKSLFEAESLPVLDTIKISLVKEIIQIERPPNWIVSNVIRIIGELRRIEYYNAAQTKCLDKITKRWMKIVIVINE
jgi:hypothetical protein